MYVGIIKKFQQNQKKENSFSFYQKGLCGGGCNEKF
jgi:hypothetical protein